MIPGPSAPVTRATVDVQRIAGTRDGSGVLDRIPRAVLAARWNRWPTSVAVLAVRIVSGAFLVGVGIGKFTDHASELADFRHYGVPVPHLAVPLAGVIEIVGGICVLLGALTRPAAVLVALNLLGALLTAGVTDGGTFHLVVGPVVMTAMLVLVLTGAPAPSIDARAIRHRRPLSRR
jgi:putative oxidoreductase